MKTKSICMACVLLSVITIIPLAGANPEEINQMIRWQIEMAQYGPTVFIPTRSQDRALKAEVVGGADIVRLGLGMLTSGIVAYVPSTKGVYTLSKRNVVTIDMNVYGIPEYRPAINREPARLTSK